ncbi:MAG: amidohydrolase family protein [Candidatus Hadarchaeum sp.]
MVDTLIVNARFVLTMDPKRRLLENAAIAVDDGKIIDIGDTAALKRKYRADRVIDAKNYLVTPGLINGHIHLESAYDKSMMDDVPVVPWCERYFSWTYMNLTKENYYYAAVKNLIEGLKTGTTTFCDCGTIQTMEDSAAKAVTDVGVRAVLGRDLMDIHEATKSSYASYDAFTELCGRLRETTDQCIKRSEEFIKKYNGAANGRLKAWMDLQQVCNVSPELCKATRELANKYDVGILTHAGVSHDMVEMTRKRFGRRDIEYLYDQGVLGPDFMAAHMAWVDGGELLMLKETNSNVVHVPGSSMHGVYSAVSMRGKFPIMVKMGINVALGNDESSTGTAHDLVRDIWTVSVGHAEAWHPMIFPDPDLFMLRTADPSPKALEMATVNGAKALKWDKEIGSLEVGKAADIVMWNLRKIYWVPVTKENVRNSFVYNGKGDSCDTVMVNGKIIMEKGVVKTVNEERVIDKVQKIGEKIIPTAPWLKNPEVWELKWVRE